MKRSRTVALTILAPAMVAFGCGQPAPPMPVAGQQAAGEPMANDCDVPAKPGEPEKVQCPPRGTSGHTTSHNSGYYHRPIYSPSYGRTHDSDSSRTSSRATGSSTPSSSSSHISRSGFGGSGSHFSGGS